MRGVYLLHFETIRDALVVLYALGAAGFYRPHFCARGFYEMAERASGWISQSKKGECDG